MNTNSARAVGVAIGILVGLVIAVLLVRFSNKNNQYKTDYDERQIKVRGDAYRYAFYTVVVIEVILFLLKLGEVVIPVHDSVLHLASVLIGCIVLCVYSIWKDAYWGINNNRKRYGIVMVVCGVLNLIPVIGAFADGSMVQDGVVTGPVINLMVCVMLLLIGFELLLKHIMEKHEEQPED